MRSRVNFGGRKSRNTLIGSTQEGASRYLNLERPDGDALATIESAPVPLAERVVLPVAQGAHSANPSGSLSASSCRSSCAPASGRNTSYIRRRVDDSGRHSLKGHSPPAGCAETIRRMAREVGPALDSVLPSRSDPEVRRSPRMRRPVQVHEHAEQSAGEKEPTALRERCPDLPVAVLALRHRELPHMRSVGFRVATPDFASTCASKS